MLSCCVVLCLTLIKILFAVTKYDFSQMPWGLSDERKAFHPTGERADEIEFSLLAASCCGSHVRYDDNK